MLVHGIAWDGPASDGGSPALRMQSPSRELTTLPLSSGVVLRLRVLPGLWCLGHVKVRGPEERTHMPCPSSAAAERGKQCGRCFALDDARLMHDFHRRGSVPPEGWGSQGPCVATKSTRKGLPQPLRAYLMQPHWLYVATFAGGATKIGTASGLRKWHRLAEQGAVHASYVAHADDGRVVRVLEDLVTQDVGLVQQVRAAAKAGALLEPRPAVELSAVNKQASARVRELLDGVGLGGFVTVEEQWQRPAFADELCGDDPCSDDPSGNAPGHDTLPRDGRRHAYPAAFDGGSHGLVVQSLSGGIALASLPDGDGGLIQGSFVANLGDLKGRRIEFGPYTTAVPALQDSLF